MSRIEYADQRRTGYKSEVLLNGRKIEIENFDPLTFAMALRRRKMRLQIETKRRRLDKIQGRT